MKKKGVVDTMISLKAWMAFDGKKEELIKAAVANYEVSLPEEKANCLNCNSEDAYEVATIDTELAGVLVKNVPVWKCTKCGDILYEARLFAEIEDAVGDATGEIDFNDLLKVN
jgi:YgiT-type zinc finger domain-containing protein